MEDVQAKIVMVEDEIGVIKDEIVAVKEKLKIELLSDKDKVYIFYFT